MINPKMEILHKNMKYVYHAICFRIIKMLGYPLISCRDIFYQKIGFMHKNGGNFRQGSQKLNQNMSKCHIKKTGMEMLLPVINLRKPFRNHLAIFFAKVVPQTALSRYYLKIGNWQNYFCLKKMQKVRHFVFAANRVKNAPKGKE